MTLNPYCAESLRLFQQRRVIRMRDDHLDALKYLLLGIDWAEDSGMNRGDIISRSENVIYVRFKAVDV